MHTLSTYQRHTGRWRWIATALVLIVAQVVIAIAVRSDDRPAAAAPAAR